MSSVYDDNDDFGADPGGEIVDDGAFDAEPTNTDSTTATTAQPTAAAPTTASANGSNGSSDATRKPTAAATALASVPDIKSDRSSTGSSSSSGGGAYRTEDIAALTFDDLRARRDKFVADGRARPHRILRVRWC